MLDPPCDPTPDRARNKGAPRQRLVVPILRQHLVVCHCVRDHAVQGLLKQSVLPRALLLAALVKRSL